MRLESEFTAPHQYCAHPEWWHSPDSDSTEQEVTELVAALVRAIQPELAVETGSAFGYTTLAIAKALERNGHGRLVSLETEVDRLKATRDRLGRWGRHVELVHQSSLDWLPSQQLQFAFFDSMYELRAEEFKRYRPFLQPGTIVAFHDWTSGARGHYLDVRAVVEDLEEYGWLKAAYVPTPRGLAVCEVL